jgi:hypothetical protein
LKENSALEKKVEKFSAAAGDAAALKEKVTYYKNSLKEAAVDLDVVATKYKEE